MRASWGNLKSQIFLAQYKANKLKIYGIFFPEFFELENEKRERWVELIEIQRAFRSRPNYSRSPLSEWKIFNHHGSERKHSQIAWITIFIGVFLLFIMCLCRRTEAGNEITIGNLWKKKEIHRRASARNVSLKKEKNIYLWLDWIHDKYFLNFMFNQNPNLIFNVHIFHARTHHWSIDPRCLVANNVRHFMNFDESFLWASPGSLSC